MTTAQTSKRVYRQFFASLGFDDDPFAYTNAAQENRLPDYFISPPYFPSVFGEPESPKSFVVFAPRGGGKTAQRIMIERKCADTNVLSITYDRFEFPEISRVSEISLSLHLKRIIRNALVGLLVTLNADPQLKEKLSKHDKQILVSLATEHLESITEFALKNALDSLKSIQNKVQDFWNSWLPAIGPGISVMLKKFLNTDVTLSEFQEKEFKNEKSLKYQLELIIAVAKKIGYLSIYVLVDRVDEAELTSNDASSSFSLISPLLKDLELLELNGLGIKFFLWDQLEPLYKDVARTDRIRQETLEWDNAMLKQLWKKRLQAYSANRMSSLREKSENTRPYSVDDLILIFANQSPRDMVRIGAQILSEQQEINPTSAKLHERAVYTGLEKFCVLRSQEVISTRTFSEFRRVKQVDFTIPQLANRIFREKQATTRNRIYLWRREGAVVDVERIDNPDEEQSRAVKLIALTDIRVAKAIFSDLNIPNFLSKKYKQCPSCETIILRDWGEKDSSTRCHSCQFDLESNTSDPMEEWKRKQLSSEYKQRYRKETLDIQLSFENFDHIISPSDDTD